MAMKQFVNDIFSSKKKSVIEKPKFNVPTHSTNK
jgi:hypothetical protein